MRYLLILMLLTATAFADCPHCNRGRLIASYHLDSDDIQFEDGDCCCPCRRFYDYPEGNRDTDASWPSRQDSELIEEFTR